MVFVLYYIIPSKYQYIWLLTAGYFFYASWNYQYLAVLLLVTGITYLAAILMRARNKDFCLWCGIICSMGILIFFKFWRFWALGLYHLFNITDISAGGIIHIIAPVGISFFVLQAVGYLVDVYKGKVSAEKNFAKYALFVSFFPSILSGLIERSDNLLKQIQGGGNKFSYDMVKSGLCLMLWGYLLKLIIAN